MHIRTGSKQRAYQLCHIGSVAVLLNGIIPRNKNGVFFRGLNFSNELVLLKKKKVQTVTLAITVVLTKNELHMKSVTKARVLQETLENGR